MNLSLTLRKLGKIKVPAHADETGNEGADRMAKRQIRRNDYCDDSDECIIRVERMFDEFNPF